MSTIEFRERVHWGVFGRFLPQVLAEIAWEYFSHDVQPMSAAESSGILQLALGGHEKIEVFLDPDHVLANFDTFNNYGHVRLNLPGAVRNVNVSSMPPWDIDLVCLEKLIQLSLQSLEPWPGPVLYGLANIKNVMQLDLREICGPGVVLECNLPELRIATFGLIYHQVNMLGPAVGLVSLNVMGVYHTELLLMGIKPGVECLTTRNVRGTHDFSGLPDTLKKVTLVTLCEAFNLSGLELPDDTEMLTVTGDGHRLASVKWLGPMVDGLRKPGCYLYDMIDRKVI
jgi:hypothetical protein